MLQDILETHTAFKLVCGAGNEDIAEVEKLVTIYSLAGCQFFDISANLEVVEAAKRGLKNAGILENRYLCVSVGISGDPHIQKAVIDQEKCRKCGKCKLVCPHNAIIELDKYKVKKQRCIGCTLCQRKCPHNAITLHEQLIDYQDILPAIISKGIDCIEFHAISTDEYDIQEKWKIINDLFSGMLCISLDRSELGDKKLLTRVTNLIKNRPPYTTIIQADGVAMSGNDDEYSTTLQAVATAQLFQNANLPVYIMMSGGTNTKSAELAKLCNVRPNCVAVGSYARKIVKTYLENDNLLQNPKLLDEAVATAKKLVDTTLENLR